MSFHCNECGGIAALLKSEDEEEADAAAARRKAEEEMKEIVKSVAFKVSEEAIFDSVSYCQYRINNPSPYALSRSCGNAFDKSPF